ncbi:ribonuclease HIII [Aneurinibacillus aneurinilyticus]|uniref:ribonuclease HIII n=1 Tax=Aneurinibacillus aneurinilyticus TaxID=1391 RepID=UPI0035241579
MNEVIKLEQEQIEKVTDFLSSLLYMEIKNNTIFFKSDDVSISLYHTGKILFQGKKAAEWCEKVEVVINKKKESKSNKPNDFKKLSDTEGKELVIPVGISRIGVDESGKGDFFGPLVTASFHIEDEEHENLILNLGVKDSKKISDVKIKEIAKELRKLGKYEIIIINPSKYNELWRSMGNVNKILAWAHARCIENMLNKVNAEYAISDQFGDEALIKNALFKEGKKVNLIQMHKAEQDVAVAAASILARDAFIQQLANLERKFGYTLAKGASTIVEQIGKNIVKKRGKEYLNDIAKIHFKTYDKIIN